MRLIIDPNLKGKQLFDYLITNKKSIISQKKSLPHHADPVTFDYTVDKAKKSAIKASIETQEDINPDAIRVLAIGNVAMWCDCQMDVLLPDASKRSLNNNKDLIYALHDHEHEVDAIIGDINDITLPDMKWTDLNVNFPGTTQVILFDVDVQRDYNKKVFKLYKKKKIKQHSIGLQYVTLEMAINDPDYKEEFALYNKYINLIPNKDFIESRGYYFVVSEIKLLENSCVLWGANSLTGTLDVSTHSIDDTFIDDKRKSPSLDITEENKFDFDEEPEIKDDTSIDIPDEDFDISKLLTMF